MTIRIGVAGLGNVGRGVIKAVENNADMKLVAVFSRRPNQAKKELKEKRIEAPVYDSEAIYSWPGKLHVDVVVLCGGSKLDIPEQGPRFANYFNTVNSFDTHADIPAHVSTMQRVALQNRTVAVVSGGWDPGIFSLERILGNAFLPGAKSFTVWGPGVSQGHSDAARKVLGVKDARSYTLPKDDVVFSLCFLSPQLTSKQLHRRKVFVVIEDGADKERIGKEIAEMPNYFEGYEVEVAFISQEEMNANHSLLPHGGTVLSMGETRKGNLSKIVYRLELASNPEFTGNILVACARAAFRLAGEGVYGAYTMIDIPPRLFSPHDRYTLLSEYM